MNAGQLRIPEFSVGRLKDRILAPLSARYRGRLELSRQPVALQAVMPFVTMSRDKRLVFVKNSKCGCTSIAHAIYIYDTMQSYKGNIHREGSHLHQGYAHWQQIKDVMESEDRFLFSVVRNPETRVISAYMDFIFRSRNPDRRFYNKAFLAYDLAPGTPIEQGFDRFLDMIATSLTENAVKTDKHWRRQVDNLALSYFRYDFIAKLESISADMAQIRHQLSLADNRLPLRTENRSSTPLGFELNPVQRNRIADLYAEDFEAFGYQVRG